MSESYARKSTTWRAGVPAPGGDDGREIVSISVPSGTYRVPDGWEPAGDLPIVAIGEDAIELISVEEFERRTGLHWDGDTPDEIIDPAPGSV